MWRQKLTHYNTDSMRVMERGDSTLPPVLNLEGGKNDFAPLSAIM